MTKQAGSNTRETPYPLMLNQTSIPMRQLDNDSFAGLAYGFAGADGKRGQNASRLAAHRLPQHLGQPVKHRNPFMKEFWTGCPQLHRHSSMLVKNSGSMGIPVEGTRCSVREKGIVQNPWCQA